LSEQHGSFSGERGLVGVADMLLEEKGSLDHGEGLARPLGLSAEGRSGVKRDCVPKTQWLVFRPGTLSRRAR
jgi:hypothetical protein